MRILVAVLAVSMSSAMVSEAVATPSVEDAWLDGLAGRVIADTAAGKPMRVIVHVPLCDSSIIACGNAKLGDGERPETNLYWATTPGFGRWFDRRRAGWKRLRVTSDTGEPHVLELRHYEMPVVTSAAWRRRGAPARITVRLEIRAWRGTAIDDALSRYAADLERGDAHIVAWVGHNRLMDVPPYSWPAPADVPTGAIAIACHTADYMENVPAETRVPLLLTKDFLFANAAPLEATVLAFARGATYASIRTAAATAYAGVREREVRHVFGAFTNPSDRRWKR